MFFYCFHRSYIYIKKINNFIIFLLVHHAKLINNTFCALMVFYWATGHIKLLIRARFGPKSKLDPGFVSVRRFRQ